MAAVSAAIVGAGLAAQAYSAYGSAQSGKAQSQAQMNIAGLEMQADKQRRIGMELGARRQSMEVLRNNQRARSLALNNATGQGAQFGSGLQGGYGQISGQSGVNLLGINQNLQLGENMFDINSQISQQKMNYAAVGGSLATSQAIGSFGKSIGGASGAANNLFGNNSGPSQMGFTDFGTGQGMWPMYS